MKGLLARTPLEEIGARLGKTVVPLVASDAFVQGCRYALIAYLGYVSFALLGSYLFGAAIGALIGGATDFGINQHWLRLGSGSDALTRQIFLRVLLVKLGLLLIQVAAFVLLIGGFWSRSFTLMMVIGFVMANLHAFAEAGEAVGFLSYRYGLVAWMRVFVGTVMYAAPVGYAFIVGAPSGAEAIHAALRIGSFAGLLVVSGYLWKTYRMLADFPGSRGGYFTTWRAARWLGMNQLAIVVDVRAPLILLGILLGEAAVGLYGLIQRTTAVVELAWASLSKLLLKSYAEEAATQGSGLLRHHVVRASWVTGLVMAVGGTAVWVGSRLLEQQGGWSQDLQTSFGLLRWATVAIGLSSLKRPVLLGLIAMRRERDVCAVNLLSAVAGLMSIPFLIWSLGIWGPIVAAVVLEAMALLLLLSFFRAAQQRCGEGGLEPILAGDGHWVSREVAGSGQCQ